MLRLREKVGLDVVKEVVKNYLQGPARDLAKLHDYARQLQIEKTLHQYLSIMLIIHINFFEFVPRVVSYDHRGIRESLGNRLNQSNDLGAAF